jgi:hypothetical protein
MRCRASSSDVDAGSPPGKSSFGAGQNDSPIFELWLICVSVSMTLFLPLDTRFRLADWLAIGVALYLA